MDSELRTKRILKCSYEKSEDQGAQVRSLMEPSQRFWTVPQLNRQASEAVAFARRPED